MTDLLTDELREHAEEALLAYNAMETTKRRHFDYLNQLESKQKKFNLAATETERQLLASLLTDHDRTVRSFQAQAQALQESAPEAHVALFKYIGLLHQTIGPGADVEASSGPGH